MVTRDQNVDVAKPQRASDAARESTSGLPGLGDRPSMHPAWSDQIDRRVFATLTNSAQSNDSNLWFPERGK